MSDSETSIRVTLEEVRNHQAVARTEQVYQKLTMDRYGTLIQKFSDIFFEGHNGKPPLLETIKIQELRLQEIEERLEAMDKTKRELDKEDRVETQTRNRSLGIAVVSAILSFAGAIAMYFLRG